MPKIFSKKKSGLNDNDPQHDDSMTIISSASMGGSSVSDRIMGRMKINLGSSFGSVDSGGGGKRRSLTRSQSTGRRRFNSSAPNLDDPFGLDDNSTVTSGGTRGGKSKRGSLLSRSQSARRFRSSDKSSSSKKGGGVSSVGVPSMEDMDSSESMALKGQSMGRRRSSRSVTSGGGSNRRLGGSNRSLGSDINTVEYTLTQLRAMNEDELQRVMLKAGVSQEDINKTIQDASNKEGKDVEKGLVALFVNSGYVKLVAKPTTSSPVDSPSNTTTTIPLTSPAKDSSKDGDKMARKTKLDKIAELKTANSLMKRENKSLKKTVKKLLGQLTDAVKEKSELQSKLDEAAAAAAKEEAESGEADTENKAISLSLDMETNDTLRKSSLSAIDEANTKYDTKSSQGSSSQQEDEGGALPAYIVPHNTTTSSSRRTSDLDESIDDSFRSENQTTTASSKQSISSDASNTITYLKRKLKKLKSSSENTEFRLKAEIDILTKEVDGLQRELGLTLKSLDSSKKRASNLKVELRTASKVNDLTREAEARDKLIDTFSGILLQKVESLTAIGAGDVTAEDEKDSEARRYLSTEEALDE